MTSEEKGPSSDDVASLLLLLLQYLIEFLRLLLRRFKLCCHFIEFFILDITMNTRSALKSSCHEKQKGRMILKIKSPWSAKFSSILPFHSSWRSSCSQVLVRHRITSTCSPTVALSTTRHCSLFLPPFPRQFSWLGSLPSSPMSARIPSSDGWSPLVQLGLLVAQCYFPDCFAVNYYKMYICIKKK